MCVCVCVCVTALVLMPGAETGIRYRDEILEHIILPHMNVNGRMFQHLNARLNYLSFQPVLHDWCNKGRGMCYPVCGMVHIKEHLLLTGNSSLCGGSGFPRSLSEWSLTICPTPYNRKIKYVECVVK